MERARVDRTKILLLLLSKKNCKVASAQLTKQCHFRDCGHIASTQAVHLLSRARAVINLLMRAASTLEITNGEQRARRKFSASWNLSLLIKRCSAPSDLADTFKNRTTGAKLGNMIRP